MLKIEPAIPERDYETIVCLMNEAEETKISPAILKTWDADNEKAGDLTQRYAAFLGDNLIGYGLVFHAGSSVEGRFSLWLTIDAPYRKQGYGQLLYDFLLPEAQKAGATMLISSCLDNAPHSLKFGEKQGFFIRSHIYDSEIDLSQFDAEQWQAHLEKVKAQGIRFSSLAGEGFTLEAQEKLYRLNVDCVKDNPSSDGLWNPTFEQFKADVYDGSWFDPGLQLLAIDGERFVGLSAVGFEEDGSAFTAFTGIDKDYRGRGIAQALKVLANIYAKEKGAKSLITNNDSQNAPMLAVNEKLGFKRKKGEYILRKHLEAKP